MKRCLPIFTLLLIVALLFVACGGDDQTAADAQLTVAGGDTEKVYTAADLRNLPATTVEADGTRFDGVVLADLLADAGIDAAAMSTVTATASDDFSATYEPDLFLSPETTVAYGADGGPLPDDAGAFRMVLPGQPGRLNVRMLARIEASP
jgi:DMSO/TMAO reductase YedYZ molybdopterin-dependent catalytic subunit